MNHISNYFIFKSEHVNSDQRLRDYSTYFPKDGLNLHHSLQFFWISEAFREIFSVDSCQHLIISTLFTAVAEFLPEKDRTYFFFKKSFGIHRHSG